MPQQFLEGYWIGPNDRVGDLPMIPAATDAQKVNKSYLPTIGGQGMGFAPGVPTKTRPALWLLTRHWSTEADLATDWGYARRLSVLGEVPQQFLEGYWIGPNDRVGDLPAILEASDADKINKSYLPTIGGQGMGFSPGAPTKARPALWLLTRHWSTDVVLTTDWGYVRRLSVFGEGASIVPQECFIAQASNSGSVGDLNAALPTEDTAARQRADFLPGAAFETSIPNPTASKPNVWRAFGVRSLI